MKCPVCGSLMRSVALTALEEAAQVYPRVSAAWRCAAWPACDTRRVDQQRAPGLCAVFPLGLDGQLTRMSEATPDSRPRDSDIGGAAWGTKK